MNEIVPIKPIGYTKEAVLYGYQGLHVVDAMTIGRLLYPEAKDPADTVQKIYNRNKEQFDENDTFILKVGTTHFRFDLQGRIVPADDSQTAPKRGDMRNHIDYADTPKKVTQKRDVRFFTLPYGVMKICMFTNSPNKVEAMKRLLQMHEAFIRGTLPRWDRGIAQIVQIPKWTRGRGRLIKQEAEALGVSAETVRRHANRLLEGKPITKRCPGMVRFIQKKHRDKYDEVISLMKQGMAVKDIAQRTGVPLCTVYRWVKSFHNVKYKFFCPESQCLR